VIDIRPFEDADLPRVADLLAAALPSAYGPAGWERFLRVTLLQSPWPDSDLPSLVACDEDATVFGFIGTNVRHATFDGGPIRLAYTAHLALAPGSRRSPVGAFLLRRALEGPQDATITDTANETVLQVWESLGGRLEPLRSLSWMHVLRPLAWMARGGAAAARRTGVSALLPVVAVPLRPILPRAVVPPTWSRTDSGSAEPLEASTFLHHLDDVAPPARLRLAYDAEFLEWLFDALSRAEGDSAPVLRRLVRRDGRVLGWWICRVQRGGVGRVVQVMCRPRDGDEVLADLFAGAAGQGVVVLSGRVEPHLAEALRHHGCVIGPGNRHLVHARDPGVLEALFTSSGLSVFDGEWWY
jgi:hypothetical protein